MKYPSEEQIEAWLAANTFRCAIGRVSKKTCESLRRRRKITQITTSHKIRSHMILPPQCENCKTYMEGTHEEL